jgi:hypothetical protein
MNVEKPTADPKTARPIALAIAVAAGVIATILRIVPHPTYFSSVGAASLFGGARVKAWYAYLIPLAIMIVSDSLLWILSAFDFNYSLGHPSRFFVYGSFMVYVAIGRWLIKTDSMASVALAGLLGGVQFWVLTNFCEWLFQPMYYSLIAEPFRYSRDLAGLLQCFVAALPFYQGEVAFSEHPFVVLGDFKFTILWTIAGDIVLTAGYIWIYGKLTQPSSEAASVPAMEATA